MDALREIPTFYKPLSLKLSRVLGEIGASEELRTLRRETAFSEEILETIAYRLRNRQSISVYLFGSSAEGTTTAGLDSDYDYLYYKGAWEVFQNLENVNKNQPLSLLLVTDEQTKPGYAKLQLIENGTPKTARWTKFLYQDEWKVDMKYRVVLCDRFPSSETFDAIHGPAYTQLASTGFKALDHVIAYRCQSWPESAEAWLRRPRMYNWPPQHLVNQIRHLGFFLVPVGHPFSSECDKEWRISLSFQERTLMFSLNTTQYQCYVLLKIIKKDLVEPYMCVESISSYHLKTCLFYTIETTPSHIWTPENLLFCLRCCLEHVLHWISEGICPNYFIPEENMFERRIHGDLKSRLHHVIQTLLLSDFKYLIQIKSDDLGDKLQTVLVESPTRNPSLFVKTQTIASVFATEMRTINVLRKDILNDDYDKDIKICIGNLANTVSQLNEIETISEHSKQQTKVAVNRILPHIELSLMSNIIAKVSADTKESNLPTDFLLRLLLSHKWNEICDTMDKFSPKLKQATFLHTLGYHQISIKILHDLETLISPYIMSICKCKKFPISHPKEILVRMEDSGVTKEDLFSMYCPACVVFLPSEKELIPAALRYEMNRSAEMPPKSRNIKEDFWFDWAVVDCIFLLYFLLYLNYRKLSLRTKAVQYIHKMEEVLSDINMINLGHRETDLNLLAWVNMQEGHTDRALGGLNLSLKIQPTHNAATMLSNFMLEAGQ